jgi:hypothetical protein
MLSGMDVPALSAGPWLVLGATLGLLLAGALALTVAGARRRTPSAPPADEHAAPSTGWVVDDLPGFLETPSGTGARETDTGPPVPLLTAPVPRPPGVQGRARDRDTGRALVAMAVAALLLVGTAAAVAAFGPHGRETPTADEAGPGPGRTRAPKSRPAVPAVTFPAAPDHPEPGDPGAGRLADTSVPVGPDGALAELTFEGIVLERRAVGVTAAYPSLRLAVADVPGGPALAHVELPTFNCLTDSAPADPVAAGCLRTPVEYAELAAPALEVAREGDGLRISGRFPTYLRPNGSGPEWTGRSYALTITVAPGRMDRDARGVLELGAGRAGTRAGSELTMPR